MPPLTDHVFTFASQALSPNPFSVVRFSGEEALSSLYRFEILLVAKEEEHIDITAVLQNPATFTIKRQRATDSDQPFHGILSAFEELHQAGDFVFYRAELRPKLWWLTLTHHNQVFLDKRVDQFLSTVLQDGGLSQGVDFEFRFQGTYMPWEYLCQYAESHFNFISRWLEREGACYWFEQGEHGEKMIASDTLIAHTALPGHEEFWYSPPSGLDAVDADKVIKRFTLRQSPLPKNVLLKDYNYLKPTLDLQGKAPVQGQGRGEIYLYGEHFLDHDEANRLAKVRAEEFLCREKIFHGLSAIPGVRPGYLFRLKKHFRAECNQQYLTIAVRHEGSQERYLHSGLGLRDLEDQDGLFYRNTFECIPASTQFRPARGTPKPRITGTLSAKIDAAGSGQYAELDEHGRYKVILPFDLAGRQAGKSSAPLRMMQPYAGPNQGMHFPLRKGVEVLLTFIDGDPDRPVIAGALSNPECQSPVNVNNQTMANITTGGGNKIHMEDQEGSQRILLHCDYSPHESYIRIGAHNDPEDGNPSSGLGGIVDGAKDKYDEASSDNGLKLFSVGDMDVRVRNKSETILGNNSLSVYGLNSATVLGANSSTVVGSDSRAVVGPRTQIYTGGLTEYDTWQAALIPGWAKIFGKKKEIGVSEDKLKGQVTDLYTHHMKLLGKVEKLQGQVTELEGEKSVMSGTIEKLQGTVSAMEGENTTLRGQVTKMEGSLTTMAGESSKMAGKVQNLEGSVTNLRGDVTNVEGNLVRLSLSCAQLAESVSIL